MHRFCLIVAIAFVTAACKPAMEDASLDMKLEQVWERYIGGDPDDARASLEDAVRHIASAELSPEKRAYGLFFTYSRLYVLEETLGNSAEAERHLVKARYWRLVMLEEGGYKHSAAEMILKADAAAIRAEVAEWDLARTDGRGPAFMSRRQ